MDAVEAFRKAVAQFDLSITDVPDDAWHAPTPCSEWDVHALVNHVVGECAWIPPLLSGKSIAEVGDLLSGDLLGADPRAAWHQAARQALDALASDDVLNRTVRLSAGDSTGAEYLSEVAADLTIHTWDLMDAIGAAAQLPADLVEFAHETFRPRLARWRAAGLLGAAVQLREEADPQARLLALLGRHATVR